MKNFFLFLCLFLTITLSAQEITQTYYFTNPQIVDNNGYIMIEFPETMQSAVLGNPMLPYKASQILLPPGCEATDVTFKYGELIPIDVKGVLFPKQPVRPISSPEITKFYKNYEIYNSKATYPQTAYGKLTTGFYRGHAIANVSFTPVVYIPSENSLAYYSSVTVIVNAKHSEKAAKALKLLKKTEDLHQIVDNKNAIAQYASINSNAKNADDYDMLILSKSNFQSQFDTLISMYAKYGIFAQFKSLSDIYSEMTGRDNQEKIRNYIIQEYTNHSIEYVLLGGDIDILPYRGFYCMVISSSVYTSNDIPADIYYSGLDGTWNDNNDGKWGEIGEDDLLLEVSVARMPFGNSTELENMLHKITTYQLNPIIGELNNPTMLGEWMYSNPDTYGSDYLRLLIGEHDDNGYTTIGIPPTDPVDTLYEQYSGFSKTQVLQYINDGPSFVYHAGHASQTYVMALYNSDITNSNFSGVDGVNHNYTFVYTHGCDCGAFDYSDCIAEKMVTISNFAVGGCFNSRYGWFNEGSNEGPSGHLNREFVNALYNLKCSRYGMAQKLSKIATAPWVTAPGQWEDGALRWCMYDCNALADPATQVWIADPYTLSVGHVNYINPTDTVFHLTVYNLTTDEFEANARCVLLNGDQIIGKAITDENGECDIQINGGPLQTDKLTINVSSYNTFVNQFTVNVGGSSLSGDANMDGKVDINDIFAIISYIVGNNPQPFNYTLADVNADGQINILDIIGVVKIILQENYNPFECNEETAIYYIENGVLYIESPVEIRGVQMDFTDSVTPVEKVFEGFEIVTSSLKSDKYIVLAYGLSGESIPAGKHAIVNVKEAELLKIILSDKFGCKIKANGGCVGIEDNVIVNSVYPNPFNKDVSVKYNVNGDVNKVKFIVNDITGKIIYSADGNCNDENIFNWIPENINGGIYFINMFVDGILINTSKVIYQK